MVLTSPTLQSENRRQLVSKYNWTSLLWKQQAVWLAGHQMNNKPEANDGPFRENGKSPLTCKNMFRNVARCQIKLASADMVLGSFTTTRQLNNRNVVI